VEACAKAVKQNQGLYFAYKSNVCFEQPEPWSECKKIKPGPTPEGSPEDGITITYRGEAQ